MKQSNKVCVTGDDRNLLPLETKWKHELKRKRKTKKTDSKLFESTTSAPYHWFRPVGRARFSLPRPSFRSSRPEEDGCCYRIGTIWPFLQHRNHHRFQGMSNITMFTHHCLCVLLFFFENTFSHIFLTHKYLYTYCLSAKYPFTQLSLHIVHITISTYCSYNCLYILFVHIPDSTYCLFTLLSLHTVCSHNCLYILFVHITVSTYSLFTQLYQYTVCSHSYLKLLCSHNYLCLLYVHITISIFYLIK